ncbi:MAG: cyclase family protein [Armatimonadota bacterium]
MSRLIDLSLDIYDKSPAFPTDPETSVVPHLKIENSGYNIAKLVMSTHLGTHVDAPFHLFGNGTTVDRLDLTKGFGPAWVLDFTDKGAKDAITRQALERHSDKISKGARIIIRTGWDKVLPEERYFTDCPGLAPEACAYLAESSIACLAMDMPTVYGPEDAEAHRSLLGEEVLIVEGLANLDRLSDEQVLLVVLPLRIRGGDGSPCRVVAVEGFSGDELSALESLE